MPAYGMPRIGQRRVDASKLTGHRRHSQHSSGTTPRTLVSHTIEPGFAARVHQELDEEGQQKLKDVDGKNKIYDYCTDSRRFPDGYPLECALQ